MVKLKHKLTLAKAMENGGNITAAMRDTGYSPNTYNNPKNVTETKSWKELVSKTIPDSKLLRVLDEGLEANKIISANVIYGKADEKTNDFIEVPDHPTRHKFLETGLRVKGYQSEEGAERSPINILLYSSGNVASSTQNKVKLKYDLQDKEEPQVLPEVKLFEEKQKS